MSAGRKAIADAGIEPGAIDALLLASDESRYVTDIELVVDGGITLKSS